MEYAKSLIKRRPGEIDPTLDSFDDIEESWTFIGDEEDADILKRLRNYDGPRNDGLNEQANLLKSLVKESQGGGQVDDEDRWER